MLWLIVEYTEQAGILDQMSFSRLDRLRMINQSQIRKCPAQLN